MTECGYTPHQAREMTLFDIEDLYAYWGRHPPPSTLLAILAQLWGWKPPAPPVEEMSFDAAIAAEGDMFAHPGRWFGKP